MKLIDILVQELPKRGGWPVGANEAVQDDDGTIKFFDSNDLEFNKQGKWCGSPRGDFYCTKSDKITVFPVTSLNGTTIVTRQQYEAALKQPVWDGTGLPPVGVECEYALTGRTWFKCKVEMYVGSQGVVMSCDVFEGIQYVHNEDYPNLTFRQIRSKRDEAIERMRKVVTNYNKTDVIHAIEQLYDAGYRKLSD